MSPIEASLPFLNTVPLFADTSQETLLSLSQKGLLFSKDFLQGEAIDTEESALYVLLQGRAHIFSADSGRSVILKTLEKGAVFGAAALFCKSPLPLSSIRADHPCRVLVLSKRAVCHLLESDRGFLYRYLSFLCDRVEFLNRKIRCFTAGSAERRLALWLASEEEDCITLPASLSAFAEMLDIGRASLYRAFERLEREGLLKKDGRLITVIDREKLLNTYETRKEH